MNGTSEKARMGTKLLPGDDIVIPAKKPKKEGLSDQTFNRLAAAGTTIASLGTTFATVYLFVERNKNK